MSGNDHLFSGTIAELYESLLVPMIFAPYAKDLARRVAASSPRDVLETAAGTGAVTRALAPLLPANARYVVTDLNQPMLDQAARLQGGDTRIAWRQADALALPFGDAEFDAVACQFGVMFFPDRVKGLAEARRVLRPDGTMFFNAWDEIAANEAADLVTRAAAEVFPADPPRFLARTPHGYCDSARIRADVAAAGFGDVAIETIELVGHAPSARIAATAYCRGTPLRSEIEARDSERMAEIIDRATDAIAARLGEGPIAGRIRAHVVAARR